MRTALYRHFAADGSLLYVGISNRAISRLEQHRRNAEWYEAISRVDVQWFDDRPQALEAEARAIREEGPKHNIAGMELPRRPPRAPKPPAERLRSPLAPDALAKAFLLAGVKLKLTRPS